jgi:hypothetical protein
MVSASGRSCPRCQSPRVDGAEGDTYDCGTCGATFPDPLERETPDYGNQQHNLSDGGTRLKEMDPDDWPPGGGRGE